MTLEYFTTLPDQARVWVYQAHKPFASADIAAIREELQGFAQRWASHSQALKASAELLEDRFIVLAVDESQAGASGCSIDSSVAFLKALGAKYQRDLFDRMRFSYVQADGSVVTVDKDEFATRYAQGELTKETLVFDPLVKNIGELRSAFQKKLADSWHERFV